MAIVSSLIMEGIVTIKWLWKKKG